MLRNLSCPAVSHICNLTIVSEVESRTRFVTNDAPMVEAAAGLKVFLQYLSTSAVFPTPVINVSTLFGSVSNLEYTDWKLGTPRTTYPVLQAPQS